jgi:hypothetical protein
MNSMYRVLEIDSQEHLHLNLFLCVVQNFNARADNSELSPSSSGVANLGQQIINEQPIYSQSLAHGISMASNGDKDMSMLH